ncbi:L,D-transpeptidase family protein [Clostridium uliginosum]|uniref:Putative peptidoglycan binding domain-containing protein n=1 Tax=Clostridium uliginosum TaxID=119641 RepID=A0A1I1IWY8_9CLOT|nr:L,D-transpeptidase family protein [Clostridium uliginosum]SFC40695.1 Putative peptidoglycan binding domain-containing protein [Clostridium uliginosum]
MKNINMKKLFKSESIGRSIIFIASIVLIYLLISLYFVNHYFFNTVINGVNVSLKAHDDVNHMIRSYIKDYELQLIERNEETEEIIGQDIRMQYNEKNDIAKVSKIQNSYKWISSLLKEQDYYVDDLFLYNKDNLANKINKLNCLNKDIIEPQNVSFKYSNGLYEVVEEVYGNKIHKDELNEDIKMSILQGKTKLDLDKTSCYENPKYTLSSDKTVQTKNLLNKYAAVKINYIFGNQNEILDENIINQWLSVDDKLEVVINEKAVNEYVKELSKKYDTVGIARKINTSTNKIVEVKGGFYGWRINCAAETKALLENIKLGELLQKEPIYTQKALFREEDDIGNTYVEINITRQHLWFYKAGKLITQGDVVTGDPNKGNSTYLGVYMLNYKEKGSTLNGANYESKVDYWMPFNGNIGIHDASWRDSFGGEIYKRNGTHGCINAPLYLAKTIFDNIEDGTPIICYEE